MGAGMSKHLQTMLDKIEAEAMHKSAMALAGVATIEAAYSLRDRLVDQEGFEPLVTFHYHYDQLRVSIHAQKNQEDMLRIALAGLDIEASESAGEQHLGDNVYLSFDTTAQWYPMREAA